VGNFTFLFVLMIAFLAIPVDSQNAKFFKPIATVQPAQPREKPDKFAYIISDVCTSNKQGLVPVSEEGDVL
jgi:hypothetical protein